MSHAIIVEPIEQAVSVGQSIVHGMPPLQASRHALVHGFIPPVPHIVAAVVLALELDVAPPIPDEDPVGGPSSSSSRPERI
jgi:hypothetical protein